MSGAHLEGNERKTRLVAALTAVAMVAEIAVGMWSGSLALLADGWHMATHAGALGLAALAYWYARRHAASDRYVFGTGKVLSLSAFSSAFFLVLVAIGMIVEAAERLVSPHGVAYEEALAVAWIGLAVNILSVAILGVHSHDHGHHDHGHHDHGHHDHGHHGHGHHDHGHHDHGHHDHGNHGHAHHGHGNAGAGHETRHADVAGPGVPKVLAVASRPSGWAMRPGAGASVSRSSGVDAVPERAAATAAPVASAAPRPLADVNLRGAYLHVVADAMTSVLAIVALLAGQRFGLLALDPLIAVVGAVVILKWAWGLIAESGAVLLDRNRADRHPGLDAVVANLESSGATLRIWDTGAGELAALVTLGVASAREADRVEAALRGAGFTGTVAFTLVSGKKVRGP